MSGDRGTEEPAAGADPEPSAAYPHADIVERLLEYQRRLREETGGEPPAFGKRPDAAPSDPALAPPEREPEPEPVPEPAMDPAPSDARLLKERIDRLDETLARISAMLPLLRGETKREHEP